MSEEKENQQPGLDKFLAGEAERLGFQETAEMQALHQRLLSMEPNQFNQGVGEYIDLGQKMITKISIGLILMQASINVEKGVSEYVLTSLEDAMNYCYGIGEDGLATRIEAKIAEIEAKLA